MSTLQFSAHTVYQEIVSDSMMIQSAKYNPINGDMIVNFDGKKEYTYFDVPLHLWNGFKASKKQGTYFNDKIKKFYFYQK